MEIMCLKHEELQRGHEAMCRNFCREQCDSMCLLKRSAPLDGPNLDFYYIHLASSLHTAVLIHLTFYRYVPLLFYICLSICCLFRYVFIRPDWDLGLWSENCADATCELVLTVTLFSSSEINIYDSLSKYITSEKVYHCVTEREVQF